MLDVKKMIMLREVALRGSVTGAAQTMGLSPSTVSQQLSRFEAQCGVTLLEPDGRGVRLTIAAARLVAHAEVVISRLEEAETELVASRGVLEGRLRLATFHTFAAGLLAATTKNLAAIAPGIELRFTQIDGEEAIGELLARRVDIIIVDEYPGFPIPPTPGLVRTVLGRESIDIYAPFGSGGKVSAMPWAMEPGGTDAHRWAISVCRAAGIEPRVQFESPDPYVHRRLVEQGIAAAFLPAGVASGMAPASASVTGVPDAMHRTLLAFVRKGTERAPGIQACRTAIEQAVTGVESGC